VAVEVDGRPGAVPAVALDGLRAAEPADVVRLLPPSDPLLQGRDRDVLVPDRTRHSALWTAIGGPGAVLSGVDLVGTWRSRQRGAALDVTVEEFRPLAARERAGVEEEFERIAVVRGARPGALR
jgi:hypothetical protein